MSARHTRIARAAAALAGARSGLALVVLAVLALGGGGAAPAAAAEGAAVKCGRVYQDRPCAGRAGRLVAPTQAQKAVAVRHPVDAACQRRGAQAQTVIDARAEGQTEEQQLAAATHSAAQKRLIAEVFRQAGSAAEQRAAVEQGCMAERQRLSRGHGAPAGKP